MGLNAAGVLDLGDLLLFCVHTNRVQGCIMDCQGTPNSCKNGRWACHRSSLSRLQYLQNLLTKLVEDPPREQVCKREWEAIHTSGSRAINRSISLQESYNFLLK